MTETDGGGGAGGEGSGLEMSPDTMRRLGYRVVDALVERWDGLREDRAWTGASRAELEPLLREEPPAYGRDAEEVIERALDEVLSRAGRIDHPRFFAFIPSCPTWPSVLADFLAAGFNVFQGTWLESAGPSQVELVVLDWFRRWLDLPEAAGGLLTSGGSAANLVALVAARERAEGSGRPAVYLSEEGHSSLERAARIAGVGREGIRTVATDTGFRLAPGALDEKLREDRASGWRPVAVCASAGATNTGAVDPLSELARICRDQGVWFHVDAAYGGFAVLTDRGRSALEGIGLADSVTLDPHKWLFQPYEAGCVLLRDPRRLEEAFRVLPEYLQDTELGLQEVNFANRGVQLSRSFRALKIWMSVQTFGLSAFREAVGRGIDLALTAEERIRSSASLELLSPASLGIVCFRCRPPGEDRDEDSLEELNARVQARINEDGFAMMSSTRLAGRYSLRLCILNYRSRRDDVLATLERVEALGTELAGG